MTCCRAVPEKFSGSAKADGQPLAQANFHQLAAQFQAQASQVNTVPLMLLSAISVPVLAIVGLLGLRGPGPWRVVAVTAFAVAMGLAVLALITLLLFALKVESAPLFFAVTFSVPLASYAWCHLVLAMRLHISPNTRSTAAALGLLPLFGLGLYLWLLVGCSAAKECL